jgi:hypothetical protein
MSLPASLPLVFYSAVSTLAYWVAERHYAHRHYVWCAPARHPDRLVPANPPSSNPVHLYWEYHTDIERGDEHSSCIERNRSGLIRGAAARYEKGWIDETVRQLIVTTVRLAPLSAFRPLFIVIPSTGVRDIVRLAPVGDRAHVTSEEYVLDELPRSCFDAFELGR